MAGVTRVTLPATIVGFRAKQGLDQGDLDRLFGFKSKGRATRRWEAEGAPCYVTILMSYADRFGIELMKELADERDRSEIAGCGG